MLNHACKAERDEVAPWLERARAIIKSAGAVDPIAREYDAMNERERSFWLRAAGAADAVKFGKNKSGRDALKPETWEAVRAVMIKSAQRARAIVGVC